MPSESKAQQRLMGAAYAAKKNKTPLKELSPELQKLVKSMNKKQLREYATTSHSNLPEHKKTASDYLFAAFVKGAMCKNEPCKKSEKMNNKNDDQDVKEKKVQDAGKKVKIIESLGGAKAGKPNKKATSLNLKQYKTKKTAAGVYDVTVPATTPVEFYTAGLNPSVDDILKMGLKDVDPTKGEFLGADGKYHNAQELPKYMRKIINKGTKDIQRHTRVALGNASTKDKILYWLDNNKDVLAQSGISALVGLGGYGTSKLIGGNEWVNTGVGLTSGALAFALQDPRVRKSISNLLNKVSGKISA